MNRHMDELGGVLSRLCTGDVASDCHHIHDWPGQALSDQQGDRIIDSSVGVNDQAFYFRTLDYHNSYPYHGLVRMLRTLMHTLRRSPMARSPIRGFDGQLVRQAREDAELTRAELADQLHITTQAIKMWEIGGVSPSPKAYVALCHYFGQSTWYFAPVPEEGRSLTDYRQRAGISLPELSALLSVPVPRVQAIEEGESAEQLSAEQVKEWSEALGLVPVAWHQVHCHGHLNWEYAS